MLTTFGVWGLQGQAADLAKALELLPLSALAGLSIAALTDARARAAWRELAFLASIAATAAWQA